MSQLIAQKFKFGLEGTNYIFTERNLRAYKD